MEKIPSENRFNGDLKETRELLDQAKSNYDEVLFRLLAIIEILQSPTFNFEEFKFNLGV